MRNSVNLAPLYVHTEVLAAGGIAGKIRKSCSIENCYNNQEVRVVGLSGSNTSIGGILSKVDNIDANTGRIYNSYSTGLISNVQNCGAIAGTFPEGYQITYCYYLQSCSTKACGGLPRTNTQLKAPKNDHSSVCYELNQQVQPGYYTWTNGVNQYPVFNIA